MEHLVERIIVTSDQNELFPSQLPDEFGLPVPLPMKDIIMRGGFVHKDYSDVDEQQYFDIQGEILVYNEARKLFEKNYLTRAVEKYGSIRKAAPHIGIDHSTIVKRAARYNINFEYKNKKI